ncbi:hypothetical protein TI04_10480 [Achromatium sp. WMS2]|nr:hypothetical protein TI04_10480 [Achromatium sp. WMS2]
MFVNNTSTYQDQYNLTAGPTGTVSGVSDSFGTGWDVTFHHTGANGNCAPVGSVTTNTSAIDGGQSEQICAKVTIPANATAGSYEFYFEANSPPNANHAAAVLDVKRDRVVVVSTQQLQLIKEQALDATCAGNCGGTCTYSRDPIDTDTRAVPGACIRYRITAIAQDNITSVVLTDTVPNYTVFDDGSRNIRGGNCGSGAVDAPAVISMSAAGSTATIQSKPNCDGTGPVIANVGNMALGNQAVLTFGVMINK